MSAPALVDYGIAPQPGQALTGNVAFIPPGLEGLYKEPFSYSVSFAGIATNQTQTASAQVNNDSYFVVVKRTASIFDTATKQTNLEPRIANFRVKILDTSSGKFSMDIATPLCNLFGTGQSPNVELYRSHVFLPGGQILVELTSLMTATQDVILTFEGFKVYNVPDQLKG